ncbi:exported hypothetical protein [Frankia sp. AgKG'84/4]
MRIRSILCPLIPPLALTDFAQALTASQYGPADEASGPLHVSGDPSFQVPLALAPSEPPELDEQPAAAVAITIAATAAANL